HGTRRARAPRGGGRDQRGRFHVAAPAEPRDAQAHPREGGGEEAGFPLHVVGGQGHEVLEVVPLDEVEGRCEEGRAPQAGLLRRAARWRGRTTAASGTSPGPESPSRAGPADGVGRSSWSSCIMRAGGTTTSGSRSAMR